MTLHQRVRRAVVALAFIAPLLGGSGGSVLAESNAATTTAYLGAGQHLDDLGLPAVRTATEFGDAEPDDPGTTPYEMSFTDEECDLSEPALAHSKSLRRSVGLAWDDATITASMRDNSYRCTAFGVLLTASELQAYVDVLNAQGELSLIAEAVVSEPTFAGAYFEGSQLTIASTDGQLGIAAKPSLGSLRLVVAKYAAADLQKIAFEVAHDRLGDAEAAGITLSHVSVNPKTNRVEIGVAKGLDAAEALYRGRYGDAVTITLQSIPTGGGFLTCTKNDCGTKGGLVVDHPHPTGCTSGFISRAKQGYGAWNGYVYTAGHCIWGSGGVADSNNWHNGAGTITWGKNKAESSGWYGCGLWSFCHDVDQGLFGLGTASVSRLYFVGGGTSYAINARTPFAGQFVGQMLQRYGRTSGLDSGVITDVSGIWTESDWGVNYIHYSVVEVDMVSDYGDSGSGFFRTWTSGGTTYRSAYGVLSGGDSPGVAPPTYYAPWDVSLDPPGGGGQAGYRWFIEPCITASCGL